MSEPTTALTRFLAAYETAPTAEQGLAAALYTLAESVAPPVSAPPDDFDLEEWGRYSKQAAIRRRIQSLARELLELSLPGSVRPAPAGGSESRDP